MDKTFSGFHDLIKNCPKYITVCKCYTIGQGLVDDYTLIPIGNGENIYTLRFIDKSGNRHIFKTCDKFIEEWETGSYYHQVKGNSFKFTAYGKFDNEKNLYGYLRNCNCSSKIFNNGEWILREIRLQITNLDYDDNIYLSHDYEYIDHLKNIRKYIHTFEREMGNKPYVLPDSDSSGSDSDSIISDSDS